MTRSILDRQRTTGNYVDDTADTLPLPIIDVADGYGTGLKVTEAIETLANEAEEIGISPDSDGAVVIGDRQRDHLVIEQDVEAGDPGAVTNTLVVASKNTFYRFRSRLQDGKLVGFQVIEEAPGVLTQRGEFSGPDGSELPPEAVNPTLHLTEAMMAVTDALCRNDQISKGALDEVVEQLSDPEAVQHSLHTRKVMGSTALGRLFTKVGLTHHAA